MFLVANLDYLIPVFLCIGEVVPAQGHRYLATSPDAAVSHPNTQSGFPESSFVCLILRFSIHYCTVRLDLLYCLRVLPRFRDFEVW